jgi:hypothetical protein
VVAPVPPFAIVRAFVKLSVGATSVPVNSAPVREALPVFSVLRCENRDVLFAVPGPAGAPPSAVPYKKYLRADCMFATSVNDGIDVLKAEPSEPINSAILSNHSQIDYSISYSPNLPFVASKFS